MTPLGSFKGKKQLFNIRHRTKTASNTAAAKLEESVSIFNFTLSRLEKIHTGLNAYELLTLLQINREKVKKRPKG